MQNLKTPMGTVKKGIAKFNPTSTLTGIGPYAGIPLFESSQFNNSQKIIKQSNTNVLLKAGGTYRLTASIAPSNFSNSDGYATFRWTNHSNSTVISNLTYAFPVTATTYKWASSTMVEAIITCESDTLVGVATDTLSGTIDISSYQTYAIIEELEAYLIPTDPTKYTDVINYTSATGSVLIPSGLPIGTKKLIRKLNATQGTVTITCTGETFTPSGLSSITLNSDGDFWLVEKVSNTRWDLVDGKESGSNANGEYLRLYNGAQKCTCMPADETTASIPVGVEVYRDWTYPRAFADDAKGTDISGLADDGSNDINTGYFTRRYMRNSSVMAYSIRNLGTYIITRLHNQRLQAEGRWY